MELVDLREVVEAAVNLTRLELRHRATLVLELQEVPTIPAHRGRLTQVAVNLLVNASQALDTTDGTHTITIGCRQNGSRVEFFVEDDGCGMEPAVVEQAFEAFFTTKEAQAGPGGLLSICADIVRSHEGTISCQSTPGVGSRFLVELPLDTGLALETEPEAVPAPPAAQSERPRVLLIDDEAPLLAANRRALERRFDVVVANGGAEGLGLLEADPGFDAIVCDLVMPDIDGIRIRDWLRDARPELLARTVFTTGAIHGRRFRDFVDSLDGTLLPKPYTARQLAAAVEESMGGLV